MRRWAIGLLAVMVLAAVFGAWTARRQMERDAAIARSAVEMAGRADNLAKRLAAIDRELETSRRQVAKAKADFERRQQQRRQQQQRQRERRLAVTVTAYDLGVESCGKSPGEPGYGVAADGTDLRGQTRESARAIAVDPGVIPLGSLVRLEFADGEMRRYDGVYVARDTGGAVRGNRVDLFMGESARREAMALGRRKATAVIIG